MQEADRGARAPWQVGARVGVVSVAVEVRSGGGRCRERDVSRWDMKRNSVVNGQGGGGEVVVSSWRE